MATNRCGIYRIYNTVNGKSYIGKDVRFPVRVRQHFKGLEEGLHYNTHFQRSFDKYGREAFQFELIEKCEKEELAEREKHHINSYNSLEKGYNMTAGGDGTTGRKWTKKQYETMKVKMKGNKYGVGNKSHTGLKHTKETKDKIARNHARLGKFGSDNVLSKTLYQYSKDGKFIAEYIGLSEVCRKFNIKTGSMSSCLKGKSKTCVGYKWFYEFKGEILSND
jgi:group I intron endonuclease